MIGLRSVALFANSFTPNAFNDSLLRDNDLRNVDGIHAGYHKQSLTLG